MIRVAIIADTSLRAESLADALRDEEQFKIVSSEASLHADVLVAVNLLPAQTANRPLPTIIISDGPADRSAFRRNIRAWLPARTHPSEIVAAIVAAAQDLVVLTSDQSRHWLQGPAADETYDVVAESLTPRESQVLRMMSDGWANKEIAAHLHISDHTAKYHVAQILAKLGASSRTEAVSIGIRRGLVTI